MSVICNLLDELAGLRQAAAAAEAEIERQVPDLIARKAEIERQAKALEDVIKDKAKYIPPSQAHTLRGGALQLVWVEGGPVSYIRPDGWSIRKVGKK